mgnify:CR=1 FL=1
MFLPSSNGCDSTTPIDVSVGSAAGGEVELKGGQSLSVTLVPAVT